MEALRVAGSRFVERFCLAQWRTEPGCWNVLRRKLSRAKYRLANGEWERNEREVRNDSYNKDPATDARDVAPSLQVDKRWACCDLDPQIQVADNDLSTTERMEPSNFLSTQIGFDCDGPHILERTRVAMDGANRLATTTRFYDDVRT